MDIGLPQLDIIFKGLGKSAVARGEKGVAVLILKDDTDQTFTFAEYASISDLTSDEQLKYTAENVQYIKDCLDGTPLTLLIARMNIEGTITDLLNLIKGKAPRNCWIGMAEGTTAEHDDIVSFVKSEVTNNKKRYKAFVYNATVTDNMHIVNFTNPKVTFADDRSEQTGEKAVSYMLGYFAGLPLTMSGIAKVLSKFDSVEEPEDLEGAVNDGELVLFNEEGDVKVARAINSLVTTSENVTDDMKFIIIVESMDLMYSDIYTAWNDSYKGKYKNKLYNQLLLIGAISAYFEGLEKSSILDEEYDNETEIDIEAQRLLNYSKYGADVVQAWSDKKAMTMTYGTNVVLLADVKILNAMEDFKFEISM